MATPMNSALLILVTILSVVIGLMVAGILLPVGMQNYSRGISCEGGINSYNCSWGAGGYNADTAMDANTAFTYKNGPIIGIVVFILALISLIFVAVKHFM